MNPKSVPLDGPLGCDGAVAEAGGASTPANEKGRPGGRPFHCRAVVRLNYRKDVVFRRPGPPRRQGSSSHLVPTNFTSKIVSNTETSDVTMALDEGNVRELAATPPPSQDHVPVTAANRPGIVDPLTAVLLSAATAGETLSQEACRRTLPIFDGHQRYDLKLAFKRMDKVTAQQGYAGPVVVCSVSYEPIAGHRASMPLVKY